MAWRNKLKKAERDKALKIIPLGGLESIGMNITAFEYGESIVVVDCGISFPDGDMLGVDLVIPDVSYLVQNWSKVKGFVITHGHEDHIGAIPYIMKQINVPIYATKLTIGIIDHKLSEHELLDVVERNVVSFGDTITLGDFRVEFIKTNHSIVDAAALAITCPVGTVIHTGDFKVDYTPVYGDAIDLQRFAQLGEKGVLAILSDSTNAERPGFTPSEKTVGKTFDSLFMEHQDTRIIIATFASNVDRVQQIINSAYKYGRKVVVEGRSMVNIISTAQELGYLNIPEDTLIDIEMLKNYPDEKTVIITTGSQGESMAALSRMAFGYHKKVSISVGDTVIFSSNPIPGNEKAVTRIINELCRKGAEVIFQDVHVSGHACAEELKLIYTLARAQYVIPVHGEYKHRRAASKIAHDLGYDSEHVLLINSGDVLAFPEEGEAEVVDHIDVAGIMVDGLGVGDVGNTVLRDRQKLSVDGIIIVVMAVDPEFTQVYAGPEIYSRGFTYVKESDVFMDEASELITDVVERCIYDGINDWGHVKGAIREQLGEFVWKKTKRKPMMLIIIQEI